MGKNSYKPHSPDRVMQQRFGDCKDKSYLLCTLLQAMNIEASPVLISTSYKKTITNWLPSPALFDHCTVSWLNQAGVKTEFIRLENEGLQGNGHMMMLEKNSDDIIKFIAGWLEKNVDPATGSR